MMKNYDGWMELEFQHAFGPEEEDPSWRKKANCLGVDPDLFFPLLGESVKEAKAVCKDCQVREECLEFALNSEEKNGIWGGLSERQRRPLRKQRRMSRET